MKIAILGYGRQGSSAYRYWGKIPDTQITICELNKSVELPDDVEKVTGLDYLKDLSDFDLIVRSPIIHPRDIVAANSEAILSKVTSVTNEFFRVCPSKNIIGVTGTKGKGTTSTLIAKMLEASGKRVHLGGNIGIPPLQLLENDIQPEDWVVLELANFQLIDLKYSPPLAVCLLIAPEHLDWHKDMEQYLAAKKQLFIHQTSSNKAIYYGKDAGSKEVVDVSIGQKIPYFEAPGAEVIDEAITIDGKVICNTDELKLLGAHNWQNACAAVTAVWQVDQSTEPLRKILTTFGGLEHRLEFVKEAERVKFYNDSFASAPPATVAAIEAIPDMKVLIVGGYDRNLPLGELSKSISKHTGDIRKTVLVGASAKRLGKALSDRKYTNYQILNASTMKEIVIGSKVFTQPGDAVVLSPGFPSFDMFKDFEERGNEFKNEVKAL